MKAFLNLLSVLLGILVIGLLIFGIMLTVQGFQNQNLWTLGGAVACFLGMFFAAWLTFVCIIITDEF